MKISYPLIAAIILSASNAFADAPCGTMIGNTELGKVTLNCQQVTGNATLTDSTITGKFSVLGALSATRAKFSSIEVTGNATLTDSIVNGPATITGQLIASNSAFKTIEIQGDDVQLTASVTGDIVVDSNRADATPKVQLNKKCTINGNITFQNTPGIVKMNDAKFTGKIVNGKAQ